MLTIRVTAAELAVVVFFPSRALWSVIGMLFVEGLRQLAGCVRAFGLSSRKTEASIIPLFVTFEVDKVLVY